MWKNCIYVFVMAVLSACSFTPESDDFSVTGESTQNFELTGISKIEIHCYCESGLVRTDAEDRVLRIKVTGTHDSVGYHGKQRKPKAVAESLLKFTETRSDGVLKLESHEYISMHHAYQINSLEVFVPAGANVQLVKREIKR